MLHFSSLSEFTQILVSGVAIAFFFALASVFVYWFARLVLRILGLRLPDIREGMFSAFWLIVINFSLTLILLLLIQLRILEANKAPALLLTLIIIGPLTMFAINQCELKKRNHQLTKN